MAKKSLNPKWPWADIKAQYYLTYPMPKTEFFAKHWPQIGVQTYEQMTVGWKVERATYREKFALEKISKYLENAEIVAKRHQERGGAVVNAAIARLLVKKINPDTGIEGYELRNAELLDTAEILRAFYVGAKVEKEAVDIRRELVTIHKDSNEKPEREPVDKRKAILDLILHTPKALKAAKEMLKALPGA